MALLRSLLSRRDIWTLIAVERLTEPLHLNVVSLGVAFFGSARARTAVDLLARQQHVYSVLHAADAALKQGFRGATVVKFGVGPVAGLLNLSEVAQRVERSTGVGAQVVGLDTGLGMPVPRGFRDHPELYGEAWFTMDANSIRTELPQNGRLILGDLALTPTDFVAQVSPEAPLGFPTLDVEYQSSSKDALHLFLGRADC